MKLMSQSAIPVEHWPELTFASLFDGATLCRYRCLECSDNATGHIAPHMAGQRDHKFVSNFYA